MDNSYTRDHSSFVSTESSRRKRRSSAAGKGDKSKDASSKKAAENDHVLFKYI